MAIPRFRKRLFRCKCSLKLMKMICFCAFWWWWWLKSSPSDVHNNKCSPRQIYRWLNMNIKPLLSRWNTLLVLLRVIMMTTMIGYKSRRYLSNFLTKSSCCDLQSLTFKLQTSREPSGLPTSELATSWQSWGWQFWVCPLLRIANPNYTQEFWL